MVCHELGIPEPTTTGLVPIYEAPELQKQITAWASDKWGVDLSDETEYDFSPDSYLDDTDSSPWRRDQIPPLAQWIDDHAAQFELLHQMEQREKYYFPSPGLCSPDRSLMSGYPGDGMAIRQAARELSTRAMMHIGEGDPRLAWRDLRLIFVMSRRTLPAPSTVDALLNCAIEGIASDGCKQLLSSGLCDRALLDEMEQFFADLPPAVRISTSIDKTDRWTILECAANRPPSELIELWNFEEKETPGIVSLLHLPVEKNSILRRLNQRFDEGVAVTSLDDPAQITAAAARYQSDVDAARASWNQWGATAAATISQSVRGIYAADLMVDWAIVPPESAKNPEIRIRTTEQLLRVAIALGKYHLVSGEYPAQLLLLHQYLDPQLLEDPCCVGQSLRYERRGDGFLLYSRFMNGVDDGGNSADLRILNGEWAKEGEYAYDHRSVDVVLRFPMPSLVLTKPISATEEEAEYERQMELEEAAMLQEEAADDANSLE